MQVANKAMVFTDWSATYNIDLSDCRRVDSIPFIRRFYCAFIY